jgi:protein phosphatase
MGATCACAWVIKDRLYTASVGDSRIYLVRNQKIRQLTIDHTWVQEALDHGALTPDQARNHPNVHVIRRYLGSEQPVEPDFRLKLEAGESDSQAERNQGFRLRRGDRLLLCSDGLTDLVEDEEIRAALQTNQLDAAVQYLINLANHRGGHDNITVVALHVQGQPAGARQERLSRLVILGCGGAAFIVLVALIAAVLLGLYFTRPFLPPVL